jgi:hypothetical protein
MSTSAFKIEKKVQGFSLVVAPLLLFASSLFWVNGEYSIPSATLLILSTFFWIPAFTGLFQLLKNKTPYYSVFGLWIAVFGCISGVCFAFLGYLVSIFNIQHQTYLQTLSHYPFTSQLLLFASGPLFPLSVFVLGIIFSVKKVVPVWQALLFSLAGIAFPLSRITRIVWVAHIADILFLISCFFIAISFFKKAV